MDKINVWVFAMVLALLSLVGANILINIQQQDWSDVAMSVALMIFLLPLPANLRFISAKLSSQTERVPVVNALHSVAGLAMLGGIVAKII